MYEIVIDSELFEGKRLIQQHRLVNEVGNARTASAAVTASPNMQFLFLQALGEEVKSLHGMTIRIGNPRKQE